MPIQNQPRETEAEPPQEETGWVDVDEICSTCGFNGAHLVVDGDFLYCGKCDAKLIVYEASLEQ